VVPHSAFQSYLDGKSGADEAGVVAKRCNAPAGCVLEELEVVQGSSTAGEAGQNLLPAALLLVAMGKVDECVLERELILGELLQSDDNPVFGRALVCTFLDQGRTCLLKLFVFEDAGIVWVLGAALDQDWVAGVEELLRCGGCEGRSVLQRLGLGACVEGGERHGG